MKAEILLQRGSTTEAELDAEVEAEQVGAVLVLTSDMNVELAGWDFSRKSHSLLELVVSSRDWALNLSVALSCLLANVESTSKESDETKLYYDVCECSVLITTDLRGEVQGGWSVLWRRPPWQTGVGWL